MVQKIESSSNKKIFRILILILIIFFAIKTNPNKEFFVRSAIKEYTNNTIPRVEWESSEQDLLNQIIPYVQRIDLKIFSYYTLRVNNDLNLPRLDAAAIGIYGNIYFFKSDARR